MLETFYTAIKPNKRNRNPEEEMTTAAAVDKFAHAGKDKRAARACLGVTCMPGGWMEREWGLDRNCKMLEIGGWIPSLDQTCEKVKGCVF